MQPTAKGVLFMMNGIEMNTPNNIIDILNIPVNNLERIEVIKSPSSVLYGPNGVGGIINIITKKPESDFEGEVSFLYGSHTTSNPSFHLESLLDKGSHFSIDYTLFDTKGYRDNSFVENRLLTTEYGYIGNNHSLDLFMNIQDSDTGMPGGLPAKAYKDDPGMSLQNDTSTYLFFAILGAKTDWMIYSEIILRE